MKLTRVIARQSPGATAFFAVAFLVIGIFLVVNSFAVGAVIAFVLAAVSLVGLLLQISERHRS